MMINNLYSLIKITLIKCLSKKKIDYSTWIFSSSFNIKYNYNSKYLFEYVLKNEPNVNPLYIINDNEKRHKLQKKYGDKYFIETKSLPGIKKVLNAGVWFTSASLPVYGLGLNKDRIIVNLWHGVPLKKIGLMENNLSKLTRIYFKYIFSNNYTYILITSKKLLGIMGKSFGVAEDKIKIWGQPRNDTVFRANDGRKILTSLYEVLPNYKKIILYAPTFRSTKGTKFFPFADFKSDELDNFLEENELIIFIRCHQSEINSIENDLGDRIKLINEDKVEEIMDIINIFDLLITDYASIYIDYLLTEKPMVFLPYDKEDYLKDRGLNFEYDSVTPGPKPETFENLKDEVNKLLKDSSYYYAERHKINMFFNEVNSECSPNICSFIKKDIKQKYYQLY